MTPSVIGAIIGLSIGIIGIIIFVPILSYQIHIFRWDSLLIKFKHKDKKLIYFIMALSIFALTIQRPFIIACNTLHINKYIYNIPLWIISVFNSSYIASFFVCNIVYLWTIYYRKQYNNAIAEIPWKRQINPRYRSWYLTHKNTLGNSKCIIFIMLIPFILFITAQTFIEYTLSMLDIKCHASSLISCIFIIPLSFFYCKSRQCSDIDPLSPKREVKYQTITALIFTIIYLLTFVLEIAIFYLSIFPTSNKLPSFLRSPQSLEIISIIIYSITEVTTTCTIFVSALITIYFADKEALYLKSQAIPNGLSIHIMSSTNGTRQSSIGSTTRKHGLQGMLQTMSDLTGFKSFMQHLVKK